MSRYASTHNHPIWANSARFLSILAFLAFLGFVGIGADRPRTVFAHGGGDQPPQDATATQATPFVGPVNQAAATGPYHVFLPSVGGGDAIQSQPPQVTAHEHNDYDLAEEARKRNEPPFVVDSTIQAEATLATPAAGGQWSSPVTWPFVFVTAASLPDGRILAWGGNNPTSFNGGTSTYSTVWNPVTNQFLSVNNTNHSMFCAIPTMLEDGRVFANGGDGTRERASIFDYRTNTWTRMQDMSTGRWYNGAVALPDGRVFTALGDPGSNFPEVWSANTGWSVLAGANLSGTLLGFPEYQSTWLPYLHLAPNGLIFHSGPGPQMNYLNPNGNGSVTSAGAGASWYPKYSTGIMYDQGKILVAGGAADRNPGSGPSTNQAMTIDINGATPVKTVIAPMAFARKYNASVMLPTGEVMVIGGNTSGAEFSDTGTQLSSEIWNPDSQTWRTMNDMSVPRNYHSVALLMTDGRVFSGGGGLCACSADHPDSQIFTPPYLFNADGTLATRPTISSSSDVVTYGRVFAVQATAGMTKFSLIKMSGTTHDLNSDLRYLRVPFTANGGSYQLTLSGNPNVLTPGYWMLFAVNAQGVPSVAKVIQVTSSGAPRVTNPGDQSGQTGTAVSLQVTASDPNGDVLTYSASGLPTGLSINSSTGIIAGTPTASGLYAVTVAASDGTANVSVNFNWTVTTPGAQPTQVRYVKLVELTEINNNAWASAAEFNVLNTSGAALPRTGWTASADSQETAGEPGQASNAIDGNTATIWHTQWQTANPPPPHWLVVDMGVSQGIGGFKYLPRQTGTNGTIASYQFFVSTDGVNWGNPVAQGTFANNQTEKTVTFSLGTNSPPQLAPVAAQTTVVGSAVSLNLSASDPDGDALTFSATGLPAGLSINTNTGVIAGTPTTVGTSNVTVTARDTKGATASQSFGWTIQAQPQTLTLQQLTSAPKQVNTLVSYSATATNGVNPRYKWLFGDGTPETAYDPSPNASHSFTQPGLYPVKVTVTDDRGVEQSSSIVQAVALPQTTNRPSAASNIAFETRSGSNNRVWVVNQDNDTVSVFDAVTNAKLAEVAVGNLPRGVAIAPNGNIWVTNKGAATISVINPGTLVVAQTIALPFASQPFGIAFAPAGNSAFVALEGSGRLLKLDAGSGAITGNLDVGQNVRGVAVTADGTAVLVSRFVTPKLPGEDTATVNTSGVGGEVLSVNAASMSINKTVTLQHSDKPDTEVQGRGVPNYLGAATISPDGQSAWVPSKQDDIKRGTLRDGNNLSFQNAVRAISSRIDLTNASGTEDYGARIDYDNSGLGSAVVFHPSGSYMFVALETSREVAVVDTYGRKEIWRFAVGRAPQGLAISADGLRLYVNNFMDRTVSVVDLSALVNQGAKTLPVLATLSSVGSEKLSATVLNGKQLFYDARDTRLARDGYLSCASCHNDGGQDGRVWDFTGFGEGLRNTIALRGRAGTGHGFLHWSGNFDEVQDFEGQIRNFAGGTGLMTDAQFNTGTRNQTLGDPKAGVSTDLDALAAYLGSLNTFASSPYRNADGTLTTDAQAGKTVFQNVNCAQCHGGTAFSSSGANTLFNIGTLKPSSGQRLGGTLVGIDPPTLRDVWASGPYLHDGSATTLSAAVSAHNNVSLNATQLQQVVAYLQQIGGQEATAPSPNQPPNVSITAPANNATFTAPATVNITANASDADGSIAKVEFFNGSTLIGTSTAAPYAFNWANVAAGTYAVTAKATDNGGSATTSAVVNIIVNAAPSCTLPSGWSTLDIGGPGQAGSACESGGTWTVKGGGADIWNASDQFRYALRDVSGNTTIIARVTSVQNTDLWTKAGVMFRSGTAANAKFAMVVQMPNNEIAFQWRATAGSNATWNGTRVGGTASVKWVRLTRSGNTFTAYYSTATGVPAANQWVQIGSPQTFSMSTPKAGLAVTAHNNSLLATATFTGVSVTTP